MPKWLDTLGNNTLSIFICDRCHMKRPYSSMRPDGNIPAIKVCSEECSDSWDPYRLPARQPDREDMQQYHPMYERITHGTTDQRNVYVYLRPPCFIHLSRVLCGR